MYNEFPKKKIKSSSVTYFFLMEKIYWTQNKIHYLKINAAKNEEVKQQLIYLQAKLDTLQAKLQAHEND